MEQLQNCPLCESPKIITEKKRPFLSKCSNCSFIFANPRPSPKEIQAYYSGESQYDHWLPFLAGRRRLWLRRIKIIRKLKRKGRLLDIGAGLGEFLSYARAYYEVQGTEISKSAIRFAREKYSLQLTEASLEHLLMPDNSFDVITAWHVLEHVHNPADFVSHCHRMLAPDGILVIAVPNEIESVIAQLRHLLLKKPHIPEIDLAKPQQEIHLSYFTKKSLLKLISSGNFKVIRAGLDPEYGTEGIRRLIRSVLFGIFSLAYRITGVNWYDTILIIARKV
jgi:2-polyprenyl-3-methyl-5-hydroxy-6-metoxy-1,4-benzoquinol methylase